MMACPARGHADCLTPIDHHHLGRHHQAQPLPRPVPGRHAYRATMPVRQDRGRGRSPCRCSQGAWRPCSPARAAVLPEGNALPQWPARPEGWGAGGKAPCGWLQGAGRPSGGRRRLSTSLAPLQGASEAKPIAGSEG